jgi:hypothetical protein
MNPISRATAILALGAIFSLASCATLRSAGKNSVTAVKNSTSAAATKISSVAKAPKMPKMPGFHIANLLPGNRVKVVEVREKDLKELPTGQELAKAHARERRSGFWIFGGPVDFKEPTLPQPGSELDGSLLPPRMP